jgi:hypothetical protein
VKRLTLLAVAAVLTAGCGSARPPRQAAGGDWPAAAEAARAQWYRGVQKNAAEPVSLSEADVDAALERGADAAGVALVSAHYLPLLGGTAEVVVRPSDPVAFAEGAASSLSTLLGPLDQDNRPYLVAVVDEQEAPLLVLGWTPGAGRSIGEGVGWQAPGIHSSAIVGQPVTSNSLLRERLSPASQP